MLNGERFEQAQPDENVFEAYERYLVPRFFAPGAQILIEVAELRPGERVLDVACATGSVARSAASRLGLHGKVVGLDINEGMLEMAREVSSNILPEIEWRTGNAMAIPFSGGSFDAVFCQQGLQFIPDQQLALGEMHRVLAPGGRLAISFLRSLAYNPGYDRLVASLEKVAWVDAAALIRSPFPECTLDELRELIRSAGFKDVRIVIGIGPVRYPSAREFIRQELTATSAVLPPTMSIQPQQAEVYEALVRDLEARLQDYTDDEGVVFPCETYLVTAHP